MFHIRKLAQQHLCKGRTHRKKALNLPCVQLAIARENMACFVLLVILWHNFIREH